MNKATYALLQILLLAAMIIGIFSMPPDESPHWLRDLVLFKAIGFLSLVALRRLRPWWSEDTKRISKLSPKRQEKIS